MCRFIVGFGLSNIFNNEVGEMDQKLRVFDLMLSQRSQV